MNLEPSFELDWLKQWDLYAPNSIAFKDSETQLEYSYADIYYLSCRLASRLKDHYGIRKGERIACIATNEIEYLPLFFATQRLGAILVPVNFRLTGREIAHILEDSGAEMIVFQKQFESLLDSAGTNVVPKKAWRFDGPESLSSFLKEERENPHKPPKPMWTVSMENEVDAPCMILYTSGTTGAPKGAIITNKMLHWNSLNTALRLNLNQSDVALAFLPFFHTSGWNVLLTPFVHRGARTVLLKKFDPIRVLELCEKEGVTILFGVPTTMDMMARTDVFKNADLSTLRYAIVGGEPMPIELCRTWEEKGIPIRQGYGLTEFGPNVFSLNEEDSIRKIGSIGFPNFYIEAKVVDENSREVPNGEVGELILRGPVCTPGYWRNPEATAQTIREGWLHTGDLVRRDEEGYYYVAGRKKDMFISGGENVYPVEVESFLSTHPAIREVAVIGVKDPKWGEVGKAYIALRSGFSLNAEGVFDFCAHNLAKYKIPKFVEFMTDLPKGDSGKILKRQLKERSLFT